MRYWSWHRVRFARLRRVVSLVALAAYLVGAVGVPLPAYVHKDDDTPFPCQDHACGCANAEQCWGECCCFTPSQRLAWAREHHVTLPARYLAAVSAAEAQETCRTHSGSCC